jgi:hypothetical protein
MSQYAKINSDNIIENVIVCEDSQISLQNGKFVKVTEETKNPQIGGEYREDVNVFVRIKPYESWVLNDEYSWESPVEIPNDAQVTPLGSVINYQWNEEDQVWIKLS